jgi:hypothetical protein
MSSDIILVYAKKIVNLDIKNPREKIGLLLPLSIWSLRMVVGYLSKYGKIIEDKRRGRRGCILA